MPFAKHESFYIREGWLFKGLRAVDHDEAIFVASDAAERLGLGKNMVRSLRFWMQATGLTKEDTSSRIRTQKLTRLGRQILEKDPYLELDGTLWLIHHQLLCSEQFATAWYWFFNHFVPSSFTKQEFIERLSQWAITQSADDETESIAEGSLRKDFDCLIHTYLSERDESKKSPEDQIQSPLTALGLFQGFKEKDDDLDKVIHRFRFQTGSAATIPPEIFLYILMLRQAVERPGARQVSLTSALREPMNVGRTFNIGMRAFEDIAARLEDVEASWRINLSRTGGLDQITLPRVNSDDILQEYFIQQAALEGDE
jgi:hypothetical protein